MSGQDFKPATIGGKYVEVIIDKNGATTVEAHGFAGGACREATKPLEDRLGAKEGDRVVKDTACEDVKVRA